MKKKGFTLVELLAVIAILAILVIMALPAVLRMFNQARVDNFINELNTIIRTTRQQYLLSGGEAQTYTNASGSSNKLPLTGNSDLKYLVKINGEGKVTRLQATNGDYCYNRSGTIDTAESKDVKTNCTIDVDNTYTSLTQAVFIPGEKFNVRIKQLSGNDTDEQGADTINTNITAITRASSEPSASNKTSEHIVSTSDSQYPIYAWYDSGTIYWWSEIEHPALNEDSSYMFRNMSGLVTLNGFEKFDTSNAVNMFEFLAGNSSSDMIVTDLSPIANWDVSSVTDMGYFFNRQASLSNLIPLKNWNVSSVTNMEYMFQGNTSIVSLSGLENWDTSKVANMSFMFNLCDNLTSITAIENWNTSNVTNMSCMFQNTYSLISADLGKWDTSKVTDMSDMFGAGRRNRISNLTTLSGLENWDVSNVTNMYAMFTHQVSLEELNLTGWDTSNVTNMRAMFSNTNLKKIYVSDSFVTNNVTDFDRMFERDTTMAGVLAEAQLVGGNGTAWSSEHIDKEYARIDTPSTPGYFTLKQN